MSTTTTLIVGATGNTGRRVVEQLLGQGQKVRVVVRSKSRMLEAVAEHPDLSVTEGGLLDMSDEQLADQVKGCDAVVSCLGHNMTLKGMYGHPRKLVRDAAERLCGAIEAQHPASPIKFVLMGSNGVANPNGGDDKRPTSERALLSVMRALVPPHRDNEAAASYLSKKLPAGGEASKFVEWTVVRPDDLIEGDVSKYDVFDKPKKGLFGGGTATRANVAHFMVELIQKDEVWEEWKFKMPVIMNRVEEKTE